MKNYGSTGQPGFTWKAEVVMSDGIYVVSGIGADVDM